MNNERRKFLHRSSMLVASGALTACGGGADGSAPAPADIPAPLPEPPQLAAGGGSAPAAPTTPTAPTAPPVPTGPTAPPVPTPPPTAPSVPLSGARFTVSSTTGQTSLPFCTGYAFPRGEVAAGRSVVGDQGPLQVTVKNRWPDGSMKFAILAGQVELAGAAAVTVNLASVAEQAVVGVLTTARLRTSGTLAQISAGAFGAAAWSGSDWDSPFQTWVSGPHMSSWIYRKAIGSDEHLVGWLEVRLWASGAIEVLPWVENGYLLVPGPTIKSATYAFSLNGSERMSAPIDLRHHQRTPLISGSGLSYWAGTDAGVLARPDPVYLQATELVPSYQAKMSASSVLVQQLVGSFVPLQAGNIKYDSDSMAAAGYQSPIGLLPQYDVIYLVSDLPAAFQAVIRNGFSAGRYGLHYRDEKTQRPLRFSSHPSLTLRGGQGFKDTGGSTTNTLTPAATGGNPPGWDVAHCPAVGYLPYLLTGRWYFMEQVQFATTTDYLGKGDHPLLRAGSAGLVQPCTGAWQTRSCAWEWRNRVMALCVTPDDDAALRSEFIACVETNIAHFHDRYVAKANNPYGWVKPAESYGADLGDQSPWQQDFITAAFGFSISMGLPVTAGAASKLKEFFAWKARSVVMRLGTKDGFWYVNAAPYLMRISPSAKPDYDSGAGPWYPNEKAVYDATFAKAPAWLGKVDGTLTGDVVPGERSMWGNLMPAIAYAVRHNVAGARDGYERILKAANYPALRNNFNVHPVWSVQPAQYVISVPPVVVPPTTPTPPAQTGDPVWLSSRGLGEWFEIPGTAGAGGAAAHAFSGMAYNEQTNEILIASAGGHLDSSDNRVVAMSLKQNAPVWRQLHSSSSAVKMDVAYYADGTPSSRHLYSHLHYVPQLNRLMHFGARSTYGNAHGYGAVDGFDLSTNTWDPRGTYEDLPAGNYGAVIVRGSGDVWTTALTRWSAATKKHSSPITKRTSALVRWPIAHDSRRHQLFTLNWADGMSYSAKEVFATRVPLDGKEQFNVTFTPGAALDSFIAEKPAYAGMDYDAVNDQFMFYSGQGDAAGRIYVIKPNATNVWDMTLFTFANGVKPPATPGAGVHNRFRYVPALRGFLLMATNSANLYFLRTSA